MDILDLLKDSLESDAKVESYRKCAVNMPMDANMAEVPEGTDILGLTMQGIDPVF